MISSQLFADKNAKDCENSALGRQLFYPGKSIQEINYLHLTPLFYNYGIYGNNLFLIELYNSNMQANNPQNANRNFQGNDGCGFFISLITCTASIFTPFAIMPYTGYYNNPYEQQINEERRFQIFLRYYYRPW